MTTRDNQTERLLSCYNVLKREISPTFQSLQESRVHPLGIWRHFLSIHFRCLHPFSISWSEPLGSSKKSIIERFKTRFSLFNPRNATKQKIVTHRAKRNLIEQQIFHLHGNFSQRLKLFRFLQCENKQKIFSLSFFSPNRLNSLQYYGYSLL